VKPKHFGHGAAFGKSRDNGVCVEGPQPGSLRWLLAGVSRDSTIGRIQAYIVHDAVNLLRSIPCRRGRPLLEDLSSLSHSTRAPAGVGRLPCRWCAKKCARVPPDFLDEAYERLALKIRASSPSAGVFPYARGLTMRSITWPRSRALLGTNNVETRASVPRPQHRGDETCHRRRRTDLQLQGLVGADLVIFFGSNPANDQPVATKLPPRG